jgi:hypothetical protein
MNERTRRELLQTAAAALGAPAQAPTAELTERSVASRSQAVDQPDFTRGRWRATPPLAVVGPEERG